MTTIGLLLRSLWYFRRTNLGVVLGVAVATTVITGALIIGDSLRYTLSRSADQRLGQVSHVVLGGDRFFNAERATQLGENAEGVILINGVLSTQDGQTRVGEIAVNGIGDNFADLLGGPARPGVTRDAFGSAVLEGVVSNSLAERLGFKEQQVMILRVPKPSALPIDAALVNASEQDQAITIKIVGTVPDDLGGRFSLRAEQRPPLNLYLDRAALAEQLERPGLANALLSPQAPGRLAFTLQDLELGLNTQADSPVELSSPRVFLDASIESDLADLPGQRILTYLVNTIAFGERESPYAMVCAVDGLGGLKLSQDQIAINRWLADDLGADVNDKISLTYYLPDEGDRLVEASTTLTVVRVVEIEGGFADRTLTPDFPGLAEAETLSNWDAGPAIDRTRIRNEDEQYWEDHRATPKAFVSLETGQRLWANRFGTLTAIRFSNNITEDELTKRIDVDRLGLSPVNIREQAETAAAGTVDFGQLFLSLSGFIIIAGMVLTATLFAMSAEQRARQLGALMAMGLTRSQVAKLIVGEGGILALAGACVGVVGGVAYAHSVVAALTGAWSGAVAGTPLIVHITPGTLVIGFTSAVAVSLTTIALALVSLLRRPARELLGGAVGRVSGKPKTPFWLVIVIGVALILAGSACLVLARQAAGMRSALLGFASGAAWLAILILAFYAALIRREKRSRTGPTRMSIRQLAAFNLLRRRGRSLAAVVTLSCGVFLVLAVSGFRLGTETDATARQSGTGGFALILETTQPIRYDLNTALGRDHYFFETSDLPPGSVVAFRVNKGDDASCLNLNQTARPRLLGVNPEALADREAFPFMSHRDAREAWRLLKPAPRGSSQPVPVIADANTAQWALKLPVGETLTLTNEAGQPFDLRLVATLDNTILQGSLIMHEEAFEQLFPSTSGHRLLLIDADDDQTANRRSTLLQEVMQDEGVTITPTLDRLAQYNQVQNTYLTIFQALGGLGVVLGSLGLGVIAARNLIERRSELALLSAVGLSRRRIFSIQLIEHSLLLCLGLTFGILTAIIPASLQGPPLGKAWASSLIAIASTLLAGLIAILLALRSTGRNRLTDALRQD
ncbi:MAG: FtsX-like permease family protein [Planctomycetota bacterium]